jgi:hypothetical protein
MRPRCLILLLAMVSVPVCPAQESPKLLADPSRVVRDSRGGGGKAFTIDSAILGEQRKINIAFPASYASSSRDRKYPVTIVLDGEVSLPTVASVADELTRNGQIPEMILVAIENTDRLHDLTPPGLSVSGSSVAEGGDKFLDFVERELLPEVDRQFRGAGPRVFIGHSSGGILATYVAATRSTYRCVVALDTPIHLGENWLAKQLTERAKSGAGPVRYVSYEARFGWTDETWKALVAAAPVSWKLHREKLPRESHESMPMLGMYLGLREVFSDYSMVAAPEVPTTSILPYYARIGESLGAALMPPKNLLTNVVEDLLMEGRGAEARAAYDMRVAGYGAPTNRDELIAQIEEVERRPPLKETVEGLLATPFPTPDEARPYIGEWTGDIWMNADELVAGHPRHVLHVSVVDGRVVGESISEPTPGRKDVQKWTYMKITPEGMTFAYMNGMRPRGMLMHEGTMKDGTLSGVSRFGGIDFKYPEGMTPPVIHFAFKKVGAK